MTHHYLRDLAWLLQSPPLMDEQAVEAGLLAEQSPSFQRFVAISEYISDHLPSLITWMDSQERRRLGHYAEDLLIWWFREQSHITDFHHSIAIREQTAKGGQRTLGELDFLWLDAQQQRIEHWELAVKFYIRCGDSLGDYVGPNRKDTLQRKWQRFTTHQLPLAHDRAGRRALADLFPMPLPVTSRVLLKGWLFHPLLEGEIDRVSASPLSAQHASGWWSEVANLSLPQRSRSSRYIALPKARWLASALFAPSDVAVLARDQAQREFGQAVNQQQQALLVAELARDLHGNWGEISRGFILPDGWSESELKLRST